MFIAEFERANTILEEEEVSKESSCELLFENNRGNVVGKKAKGGMIVREAFNRTLVEDGVEAR